MPGRKDSSKKPKASKTEPPESQSSRREPVREALPEIVQEHPEDAPAGWAAVQHKLAASSGLSVLLVDGRQPPALVASNNNSICHAFQSSLEYVGLCDPYCGDAHRLALSAGSAVQYKCHAGLQCFTVPLEIAGEQNLAAIGGRAFVSGADYRSLVDRFRAGELNDLLASEPFENVIFAEAERLDELSERLQKAVRNFRLPATVEMTPRAVPEQASSESVAVPSRSRSTDRGLEQELHRLRGELEHRSHLAESLQRFQERITTSDPSQTYTAILSHSRELLKAERGSLWVLDENSNELHLKAAVGLAQSEPAPRSIRIGEGIAGKVLETAKPLLVENVDTAELTPAPSSRKYKTKSFISYPIRMGARKIGVLNIADKFGGEAFDDVDLSLLEIIGAQIAVAVERAKLQERATQFQLMSITDPLTGLLNRRYLEERLADEVNRSQRYNYPMSCLMIDIDDFKNYNDKNGHQAGDAALKITAHALKAALRSADVPCRYGGEEFCILLPQTTLSEAGVIAERVRQRVAERDYPFGKAQPMGVVSVSIGISTYARNIDTAEKIIAAADRALYDAKARGKNRIEFFSENTTG